MRFSILRLLLIAGVAAASGCGLTEPVLFPERVDVVSGDEQIGTVGRRLAEPLRVRVVDGAGRGVAGIPESAGLILVRAEYQGLAPVEFRAIGQAAASDPPLDDFATAASANLPPVDLSEVRAWPEGEDLQVMMWFTDFQQPGFLSRDEATTGYVDLDVDQNPATGATPLSDRLRRDGGSSGIGADYSVSLFTTTGQFDLLDSESSLVGRVRGRFAGNTVGLCIPLRLLGDDDGYVDVAVLVGTIAEPTDVAPNAGSLRISRPDPPN